MRSQPLALTSNTQVLSGLQTSVLLMVSVPIESPGEIVP